MTTKIVTSQLTAPAANVGQALFATSTGDITFTSVSLPSRSVGISLVFGI